MLRPVYTEIARDERLDRAFPALAVKLGPLSKDGRDLLLCDSYQPYVSSCQTRDGPPEVAVAKESTPHETPESPFPRDRMGRRTIFLYWDM